MTKNQWNKMLKVLRGDNPKLGISVGSACRASGVSVRDFKKFLSNARRQSVEDESWVLAVPDEYDGAKDEIGGRLEDKLYDRAMNGTEQQVWNRNGDIIGERRKYDNRLALRMLERHDEEYRQKTDVNVGGTIKVDIDILRGRLLVQRNMAERELEHVDRVDEDGSLMKSDYVSKVLDVEFESLGDEDEKSD